MKSGQQNILASHECAFESNSIFFHKLITTSTFNWKTPIFHQCTAWHRSHLCVFSLAVSLSLSLLSWKYYGKSQMNILFYEMSSKRKEKKTWIELLEFNVFMNKKKGLFLLYENGPSYDIFVSYIKFGVSFIVPRDLLKRFINERHIMCFFLRFCIWDNRIRNPLKSWSLKYVEFMEMTNIISTRLTTNFFLRRVSEADELELKEARYINFNSRKFIHQRKFISHKWIPLNVHDYHFFFFFFFSDIYVYTFWLIYRLNTQHNNNSSQTTKSDLKRYKHQFHQCID